MSVLYYEGQRFQPQQGESVLDTLLASGIEVPHSCKAGACQSCLMQASEGEPGSKAQSGLKSTLVAQKFFLACQCFLDGPLTARLPQPGLLDFQAQILDKQLLCHNVLALRLNLPEGFSGHPGQYLNLVRGTLSRSYSIANRFQQDGYIELHIRRIADGRMSTYLHDEAQPGDVLLLRGPMGDCFYPESEDRDAPLLLAGTGTGLAPLQGILLDALAAGHRGSIQLVHGAVVAQDLYNEDYLQTLAAQYPQFDYAACVLRDEGLASAKCPASITQEPLPELFCKQLEPLDKKALKVFLCGDPALVNQLKTTAFLAGVSSKHIFSDPFIMAA